MVRTDEGWVKENRSFEIAWQTSASEEKPPGNMKNEHKHILKRFPFDHLEPFEVEQGNTFHFFLKFR